MWRLWPYRGAMAEPPDPRAWAETDRQGARPGTAAAVSAVLCEGAGHGVDQVADLSRRAASINGRYWALHKWSRARSGFCAPPQGGITIQHATVKLGYEG